MSRFLLTAAIAALPTLSAQEPTAAPSAPPDPKTEHHVAMKAFVGEWDCTTKTTMPGEEPTTSTATETVRLICNGLWLESTMSGEYGGQPFQGKWIMGYDPGAKQYVGVWVDVQSASPMTSHGSYDSKTKTWRFAGTGSMGDFTSTVKIDNPDSFVETCVCKDPSGVTSTMEITRKRATRVAAATGASAKPVAEPSAEHAELLRAVGEWDTVMKMTMDPSAPPLVEKGTESVVAICDGRWVWTDYRQSFMGAPFEGHALMGWDSEAEKYVSFWFDSMSPTWNPSSGTYDAAKKTFTMNGTSRDPSGKPATTREVTTWKDANTRHMKMEVTGEQGTESFEITFTRRKR